MMILISGQPGNGKTLRALALMLEEYERNREAAKAGKECPREFFANIKGVIFDWVLPIPDNDWRECPDGSYVVYDEAHSDGNTVGLEHYGRLFPSTGKPGESEDPRVRAMSTHRHRGFDLVFVTQWPSKVHHNLRSLVGKHIHMNRAMGLQRAGVLTWTRVQVDPYDERQREKAEEEIWPFPQDLFDKYQSATLHTATYKFRVPKKVWQALSMLLVMVLVGWGLWVFVFKPSDDEDADTSANEVAAQGQAPLGAPGPPVAGGEREVQWVTVADYAKDHLPRFATMPWTAPIFDERHVTADPALLCMASSAGLDGSGAYSYEDQCTCMTEQGTRYDIADGECRRIARQGPVYNPYRERRENVMQVPPVQTPESVFIGHEPVGIGKAGQHVRYGQFREETQGPDSYHIETGG